MFTGLVQGVGRVLSRDGKTFSIEVPQPFLAEPISIGESIAVNGCCLTVVAIEEHAVCFDLSEETLARTTFGSLDLGAPVNLERSLRVGDRLGGHFVQGHVDVRGKLEAAEETDGGWVYRFHAPLEFDRLLIDKGSIAVDGISLTVVSPKDGRFDAWIIPHTLDATNLVFLKAGDEVNLEFDVLAKYVAKLIGE
jgi:riboflavin synthase